MTRSSLFSILFFALATNKALGQQTPMFEFTLYFEDIKGNRDSCTIGYDTSATAGPDEIFGEYLLLDPFDTVLDVRATVMSGQWSVDASELSKKFISEAGSANVLVQPPLEACYVGWSPVIFVNAKYPPITITWDRDIFRQSTCKPGSSLLFNRLMDLLLPPYYIDYPSMSCLAIDSSYLFDPLSVPATEFFYNLEYVLVDGNLDTIPGFKVQYGSNYGESPVTCMDYFWQYLDQKAVFYDVDEQAVTLQPNPATSRIGVAVRNDTDAGAWQILDMTGKFVGQGVFPENEKQTEVEIAYLLPGVYNMLLYDKSKSVYWVRRFVKM